MVELLALLKIIIGRGDHSPRLFPLFWFWLRSLLILETCVLTVFQGECIYGYQYAAMMET